MIYFIFIKIFIIKLNWDSYFCKIYIFLIKMNKTDKVRVVNTNILFTDDHNERFYDCL
jgi:hypothetical protein